MEMEVDDSVPMSHVEELKYLLTLAKHPETISLLNNALKKSSNEQNGEEIKEVSMKPLTTTHKKQLLTSTKITSYGWDQSDKFVKIYITDVKGIDNVGADNVKANFTDKSFTVELINVGGRNYSLVINGLLNPIDPEKSTVKVKSGMVTVSLRKASAENWSVLTAREKKLKEAREPKPSKPDEKEDPGAGLMKMMQKLYDEGDDDMKRTIKKAWHDSQEKRAKGEEIM
ncbi:PREDICTED: calcyclin-binding protein-like [Amphimedon queenslandica]|uniref:Calcyclin-binding protein n=2 Tax=Amphimedon queenslandica TaxID=400682 RepID=A0A1X7VA85_AMPQE|nr:PREDICTED: calcyclin-binding protein-like [Amphimedon queenslandica]|eukprot:XP_011402649.1 PREDICTED: calcyclin-binding protein-like [Amphimedon queenslandica]